MKRLSYFVNVVIGLTLFFIVALICNTVSMLRQAWRYTVSETKDAYRSNRRAHGLR